MLSLRWLLCELCYVYRCTAVPQACVSEQIPFEKIPLPIFHIFAAASVRVIAFYVQFFGAYVAFSSIVKR